MKQSRKESIIEQTVNTITGMILAYATMELILAPWLGIGITPVQNIHVTFWLTIVSFLRGYFIRRCFNNKIWKKWVRS